ncbi:AraC family transcriptional regulator [Paenibacillus sp. S150]|uniref:helix-turn-helix transcriptional regulator n=1 Tax=Paenibacillus sp. S150 TaxID=2749826 RepID=UPI001C570BC8|nr:AraC family transcriptional regulator [Paenibacillus sp. S150]MBW4082236.1 helix-turn-helix transcriptional regulator [Paenibacillus sp. S150]
MEETLHNLAIDIHWIHDKVTLPRWKDIRQNVHVHSFYWIQEGKGTFRTDGEFPAEAGMLFYLRPGLAMEMESHGGYPLRIAMVLLSLFTLSPSPGNEGGLKPLGALPLRFMLKPEGEPAGALARLFKQITSDWVPGQVESELITKSLLYQIMYKMLQTEASARADKGLGYDIFLQAKDHLERSYSEPLLIRETAERFGVSSSYLRSLFHQYLQKSPKAYLSDIRHEHAKKQLLYTSLTMKEIAAACGYSDEFHFSKSYKRRSGQPPSALRSGLCERGGAHV